MKRLRQSFVLLLCAAAIPVAAAPYLTASPDLCFTAGSVTYRLSSSATSPDVRVAIDNSAPNPDLRVRLVDRVETADFALTDDAGTMTGNGCKAAGPARTVRTVPPGTPADITIVVSSGPAAGDSPPDLTLYVHSARISHFDAAALFALVRQPSGRTAGHLAAIR